MKLYHGSNVRIEQIDLSRCRQYKDFGTGFYLTADHSRAVTMANRRTALEEAGSPEVNPFLFYPSRCPGDIRIKRFNGHTGEWAAFVMQNRDQSCIPPHEHEYDIVIGPVADSVVDSVIEKYREEFGEEAMAPENLKILAKRLKYGSSYIQYCFCTQRAIQQLIPD